MKYILYSVLVFVVFSGIPVFLREKQSHIVADTISAAWHQREFEKRAARGARILRAIYKITPELTIPFDSVIASADGDICYFIRTSDARQSGLGVRVLHARRQACSIRARVRGLWRPSVTAQAREISPLKAIVA